MSTSPFTIKHGYYISRCSTSPGRQTLPICAGPFPACRCWQWCIGSQMTLHVAYINSTAPRWILDIGGLFLCKKSADWVCLLWSKFLNVMIPVQCTCSLVFLSPPFCVVEDTIHNIHWIKEVHVHANYMFLKFLSLDLGDEKEYMYGLALQGLATN